jgi:hypothetical protein
MRISTVVAVLVLAGPALVAQERERPADWRARLDRAGVADSAVSFVSMPPGWHISTRRQRAIFYNPATVGSGTFRIEAKMALFDPGRRHREAYGVLFGGRELDGDGQTYSYFLIRDSGEFLVKRRTGGDTETLVPWTASDAIVRYSGEGTATNVLAVECGAAVVEFYINGEKVTSLPRAALEPDGIVGLRLNHGLDVHVSALEVEKK